MVIIGSGKLGLTALCFLRKVAPVAKIIVIDKDDVHLDAARVLKKADIVQKMYVAPLMPESDELQFSDG
jgi:threonine dehydrogenase-like Zn-dependent dehydrogenase